MRIAEMYPAEGTLYCPICARLIVAANKDEVLAQQGLRFVFVHDERPHTDEDLIMLEHGVH
jgi:hypothetical protein